MKAPSFIFYGSLLGLVATLLVGCASKSRPYESTKTTVIDIDGAQTITETVKRDSKIRASGYKLDLAGFSVSEKFQEGGDTSYELNSDGAKATPQSQALEAFTGGLGVAAQLYGLSPNQAGPGIPDELQERLDALDAKMEDLDRIAQALVDADN